MNPASLRTAFIAASALLVAFAPTRPAYADDTASSGIARPAGIVEALEAARHIPTAEAVQSSVESAVLSPGEFVWNPERSPRGEVEIVVSIPLQRAYIYRGGTLIAVSTCRPGSKGNSTHVGKFDIMQKNRRILDLTQCPMPSCRYQWEGDRVHAVRSRPPRLAARRRPEHREPAVTLTGRRFRPVVDNSHAPGKRWPWSAAPASMRLGGPLEEVSRKRLSARARRMGAVRI